MALVQLLNTKWTLVTPHDNGPWMMLQFTLFTRYRLPMDKSIMCSIQNESIISIPTSITHFQSKECKNYRAGSVGPRVLPNHFPNTLLILKSDIKHLGEVLTKTMWGCALYATTSVWNEGLVKQYLATSIYNKILELIFFFIRIVKERLQYFRNVSIPQHWLYKVHLQIFPSHFSSLWTLELLKILHISFCTVPIFGEPENIIMD